MRRKGEYDLTEILKSKIELLEKLLDQTQSAIENALENVIPKSLPSDIRRAIIDTFSVASLDPENFKKNVPDTWIEYLKKLLRHYHTFSSWESEILHNFRKVILTVYDDPKLDIALKKERIEELYQKYKKQKKWLKNLKEPILNEIIMIVMKIVKNASPRIFELVSKLGVYGVKTKQPSTLSQPVPLFPSPEEEEGE